MKRLRRCIRLGGLYAALSLFLVAWPHFGSPYFRYTGSDPNIHVWNLGWPFATAIWDPHFGLQIGPFAYILPPILLGLGIVVFIIAAVSSKAPGH